MAYQCVNASNQYFTVPALECLGSARDLQPVDQHGRNCCQEHRFVHLRGSVNTGVFLIYSAPNWELRYYVNNGTQWQAATSLFVATGAWQHVSVAISSSQARLYLDGVSFTNNVSHSTVNVNEAGDLARDSLVDAFHTTFNGSIAEAAIWSAALSDAECQALAKRLSPLALKQHLHNLVLYKDLVRDLNRGVGPALTAVNSPAVVQHPPLIYPASRRQPTYSQAHFDPPFRPSAALAQANLVARGTAELAGAARGTTHPIGEVST